MNMNENMNMNMLMMAMGRSIQKSKLNQIICDKIQNARKENSTLTAHERIISIFGGYSLLDNFQLIC